jgi:uracil-DNA glycosylase family 4
LSDPRQELRDLTAAFRAHLEARGRCGLQGVSLRPSPVAPPAAPTEEADEPLTPYPTPPPVLYDEGQVMHSGRGLTALRAEIGDCQRCKLARSRRHIVFGIGNPEATLMFVGEAPGADEDEQGEPFVGVAGQLLTKMIQAMGYRREEVYICNVIKCRPPGNRNPEPDEIAACEQFLRKQIAIVQPRVIVALGKFAAHFLCGETTPARQPAHLPRDSGHAHLPSGLSAARREPQRRGLVGFEAGDGAPGAHGIALTDCLIDTRDRQR